MLKNHFSFILHQKFLLSKYNTKINTKLANKKR